MEPTALSNEELKALESVRQRLYNLSSSISSLKGDVARTHPIPPWYATFMMTNPLPWPSL